MADLLAARPPGPLSALGISVTVATLIVDQAVRAVGAHSGALATLDPRAAQLTIVATRNVSATPVGTTFPLGAPLPMPTVAREGRPLIVSNIEEKNRRFPAIASIHDPDGIESLAAYPLRIGNEVTGVILVRFTEPHDLDAADHAFMTAMSRIAAEAFERARLFEAERRAREEAETANRAKAAFLASMSHELRTPLQAALGFAQLVRSGVYGPVNEQQVEVLGRVERSQTHLARLIDDILDFARLEAGRVRVESEPVPLAEVLGDLFPLVEPQAVKKRIELAVLPPEDGMTVMADRHRLQQVLVNLVGNAIKFTPENGTIRVGALADGRTARIFIRDTGRGIPADRLQSIFEPFVQVEDSLTRTASGAGLGLAISRDLARAMGGDLGVESEFGVGSTFTVTLPLV
jgi:signal transduction histidine kinase